MLNIYYANQTAYVPVRLFDSTGAPVTGVAIGSVTCTVLKSDGTTAAVAMSGNWTEVTTGAFSGQGLYAITLPTSVTNKLGPLTVAVSDGTNVSIIVIGIVSALSADAIANIWAAA